LIKALLEEVEKECSRENEEEFESQMKRAKRGHKCFGDGAVLLRNTYVTTPYRNSNYG
jgi:hypothetical protein